MFWNLPILLCSKQVWSGKQKQELELDTFLLFILFAATLSTSCSTSFIALFGHMEMEGAFYYSESWHSLTQYNDFDRVCLVCN